MFQFVLGIHLLLCVFLIVLVLLQQGKGADVGAAFGGGSNTLFGATGATNLMVRITTGTAVLFMVTSIFLIRGYADALETGSAASIDIKDPGLTEVAIPAPVSEQPAKDALGSAPLAPAQGGSAPAAAVKTDTSTAKNTGSAKGTVTK